MPNPLNADRDAGTARLTVFVDVSDTLASGWRAGIQRVVVQLVDRLRTVDDGIELVPLVWSRPLDGFRHLRPGELEDLLRTDVRPTTPAPLPPDTVTPTARAVAEARRFARRAARLVYRTLVALLGLVRLKEPLRGAVRWASLRTVHRDQVALAVGDLPAGSVLFDLDTVWNQTWVDREQLYGGLRRRGVHLAVLVYDLLPLEHPEWFEPSLVEVFDTTLRAQAAHAELVVAISRSTAASFTDWAAERGLEPPAPLVVPLGADAVPAPVGRAASGPAEQTPLPPGVVDGRYVLVVGTVEPRKNHAVLLDAFERLADRVADLQLVVVGRPGWENDEVVRRLHAHPWSEDRLHWFRDADDELLSDLYDRALVVAVPSATEGFGLPVIEAFRHGVPVIASDGGALPEAGGRLAEYVGPHDVAGWTEALVRHAQDPEHASERRRALVDYEAPTWRETARHVAAALTERFARG